MYYFSKREHTAHYKEPKLSQNKLLHAHKHQTCSQLDNFKRWDFKDDLKDLSLSDDLTLQWRLFQTDGAA